MKEIFSTLLINTAVTIKAVFASHQMILRSINAVLIVLSVLELCVSLSSAILGIKALIYKEKSVNKVHNNFHICQPALFILLKFFSECQ